MIDDLRRPLGRNFQRRAAARRRVSTPQLLGSAAVMLVMAGSIASALLQPALSRIDVFEIAAKKAEEQRIAATAVPPLGPLRPLTRETQRRPAAGPDGEALPTVTYPPSYAGEPGKTLMVSDPGSLRQQKTAAHLPDEALIEPSANGPLPVRGADGRRPFDVYAGEPSTGLGTRIAIVIGGLGISQTGTQAAIRKLPQDVTLAFSPAGNSLDRWMQEARRNGHELLLQLPMEPVGYPDVSPGPHTLTADRLAEGDFSELVWSLGRLTNYVGVMNYMGARVSADPGAMRAILGELARRGLMYLDDGSSGRSVARDAAHEKGAAFASASVLLDADPSPAAIARQLDTLERAARAGGTAIGVASAFDVSVDAVSAWIEQAEARGIAVVPVSAIAIDPEAR